MSSAATLAKEARKQSGLSRKALAAKAGVPLSTVSRIEEGRMDPTTTMLGRLLAAAEKKLELHSAPATKAPSLAEILVRPRIAPAETILNWTYLRGFLDRLRLHPEDIEDAIALPPNSALPVEIKCLLAGIAEKVADDANLPRPRWTASIKSLQNPLTQQGTEAMIKRAKSAAPPQFLSRNIWIAESDLWRERVRSNSDQTDSPE